MAICQLCEIEADTVQSHKFWDEDRKGYATESLCDYCYKKFLDRTRPGDPDFNGGLIPPRDYVPGQGQPQVQPSANRPQGWPDFVPFPPIPGYPLPPGFQYNPNTGVVEKK